MEAGSGIEPLCMAYETIGQPLAQPAIDFNLKEHFLQHENHKINGTETCMERRALELEAYQFQNFWLAKRNKQIPYLLILRLTDLSSR